MMTVDKPLRWGRTLITPKLTTELADAVDKRATCFSQIPDLVGGIFF